MHIINIQVNPTAQPREIVDWLEQQCTRERWALRRYRSDTGAEVWDLTMPVTFYQKIPVNASLNSRFVSIMNVVLGWPFAFIHEFIAFGGHLCELTLEDGTRLYCAQSLWHSGVSLSLAGKQ